MRIYDSVDKAFIGETCLVLETGAPVSPRDVATLESLDCAFRIIDPRARLIGNSSRRWSLPYALGELLWHFSASDNLDFISYYSRAWHHLSSDHRVVRGSCYGNKIFGLSVDGTCQWTSLVNLLKSEPTSRRAVLTLYDKFDLSEAGLSSDVPCTCTLQFIVRDGRVHAITYMRSNDLYLGFGYDVFLFTMLQERLAVELGLGIGWYQHVVGSIHLYTKDLPIAELIVQDTNSPHCRMDKMLEITELPRVLELESYIRTSDGVDPYAEFGVSKYWHDILLVLLCYKAKRTHDNSAVKIVLERLSSSPYHPLLLIYYNR